MTGPRPIDDARPRRPPTTMRSVLCEAKVRARPAWPRTGLSVTIT
ncbi:MAG: hypothetical protein WB800_34385 [Streptosporangiaceae bacterium]